MTYTPDAVNFDGRVAIVTGAAQGLGRAIALTLGNFDATVAVCDRDAEGLAEVSELLAKHGRVGASAVLDVRDQQRVTEFVDTVHDQHGRIDVLVNNAGGGFLAPFLDVSARGQHALVDENFTSVTHFIRAVVPLMPRGGSIVNITSIEAFRAAPGFAIYGAMKAAVEFLSRSLALELSALGIRVNCVAPDAMPTEGGAHIASAIRAVGDEMGWKVPLGLGEPRDCAGAVVYLASELARYVTGTTIHVDGGSLAAAGWRRRSPDEPFEP